LDGHGFRFNDLVRPRDFENKTCPYCGNQFKPSRSHPHQVVCSSGDCQRRRRADYHRKKLIKDPLYRALCQDSQEMWKQRNPEYMKQYRASQRETKPGRPAVRPAVRELERLLSLAKNTLVKNTSAFQVRRYASGVWLVTPKNMAADKNTFAPAHVIVIQGITLDEQE
jgi:hypothetical protein